MNLQLHHVVSDITGVTGMTIIRAIVAGERDPNVLASHRERGCHASVETMCQALVGNYREEHTFARPRHSNFMMYIKRRWRPAISKSRQS